MEREREARVREKRLEVVESRGGAGGSREGKRAGVRARAREGGAALSPQASPPRSPTESSPPLIETHLSLAGCGRWRTGWPGTCERGRREMRKSGRRAGRGEEGEVCWARLSLSLLRRARRGATCRLSRPVLLHSRLQCSPATGCGAGVVGRPPGRATGTPRTRLGREEAGRREDDERGNAERGSPGLARACRPRRPPIGAAYSAEPCPANPRLCGGGSAGLGAGGFARG